MLSKTFQTMVYAMAVMPAKAAGFLKGKKSEVGVYIYVLGTALGYSAKNMTFVYQQMCLETAFGESNGMVSRNNAFGMSCVNVRENTQVGCEQVSQVETQGVYKNLWDSVVDRYMWDSYWGLDAEKRSESYALDVSNIYHTSAAYANNVMQTTAIGWSTAKACAMVGVPLEILAIQKIWSYYRN